MISLETSKIKMKLKTPISAFPKKIQLMHK